MPNITDLASDSKLNIVSYLDRLSLWSIYKTSREWNNLSRDFLKIKDQNFRLHILLDDFVKKINAKIETTPKERKEIEELVAKIVSAKFNEITSIFGAKKKSDEDSDEDNGFGSNVTDSDDEENDSEKNPQYHSIQEIIAASIKDGVKNISNLFSKSKEYKKLHDSVTSLLDYINKLNILLPDNLKIRPVLEKGALRAPGNAAYLDFSYWVIKEYVFDIGLSGVNWSGAVLQNITFGKKSDYILEDLAKVAEYSSIVFKNPTGHNFYDDYNGEHVIALHSEGQNFLLQDAYEKNKLKQENDKFKQGYNHLYAHSTKLQQAYIEQKKEMEKMKAEYKKLEEKNKELEADLHVKRKADEGDNNADHKASRISFGHCGE